MKKIIAICVIFVNILIAENDYIKSLVPNDYVLTEVHGDLNNDKKEEIVLNLENFKENVNRLIILQRLENNEYKILFKSDKTLSYPANNGQGFMVQSVIADIENEMLVIHTTTYSGKPILRDYYFKLNGEGFVLDRYVEQIGSKCDSSIFIERFSADKITPTIFLKYFSIDLFFDKYYRTKTFQKKLKKMIDPEFEKTYNVLLREYRNNKSLFKKKISALIIYDQHTNEKCSPPDYLNKYVHLDSKKYTGMTNDIAFFFEQTGYYEESIYLLKKVIIRYPNKTVAYMNLGDAYWSIGKKEKAKEVYRTYIKQMKAKGKEKKIPKTVLQRVH